MARGDNGTRYSRPAFMREPGIVKPRVRSISYVAHNTRFVRSPSGSTVQAKRIDQYYLLLEAPAMNVAPPGRSVGMMGRLATVLWEHVGHILNRLSPSCSPGLR